MVGSALFEMQYASRLRTNHLQNPDCIIYAKFNRTKAEHSLYLIYIASEDFIELKNVAPYCTRITYEARR